MILKYVLKNFRRRKVRTVLMILSLMVSTGLIVTMSATVETVRRSSVDLLATAIGRYDIAVRKTEISPDPFVDVTQTSQAILQADELITAVYPRFISEVELSAKGSERNGTLIALDPNENVGQIDVISGEMNWENGGVALLESTALSYDLEVGDTIDVAYSFPQPREEGQAAAVGSSSRGVVGRFPINAIVRQSGVASDGVKEGLIINIEDAQAWMGLSNRAEQLIALVEPALYESGNAEDAALAVRDVATNVQAALGDQYTYSLEKAATLDQFAQGFLMAQAIINTYGLMAFGVVGLLIHTLVMTNVQEQRREMAFLRILGSQRNYLFAIVMAEVAVIGVIGIGLGIVMGQLITQYGVISIIEWQMSQAGLTATIEPVVSPGTIVPAVVAAFVVLFLSALKPAQDAANTKVIHAINPGVADNIQLEDLEELREQRPNRRLFGIGFLLMFVVMMGMGMEVVSILGNPAAQAALMFGFLLMMVLGVGLIFLIVTRPLERGLLLIIGLLSPRLTYFARRNVARSKSRNTLISLLVLFSGVLPSFLATQNAITNANIETDVRLDMGAPVEMQVFARFVDPELAQLDWLRPSFLTDELAEIEGIEHSVGLTHDYSAQVSDSVGMRSGSLSLVGVAGDLNDVLYEEMIIFAAGEPASLSQVLTDPQAIVISEGLADALAVPLGGTLKLAGEGLDHEEEFTVLGIARRLPGFSGIGRIRSLALFNSTALISLEAFHRISTEPALALPPDDEPVLNRILATTRADADVHEVSATILNQFSFENRIWTRLADIQLEEARIAQVQIQVFLLVLTMLSFTTAVFGVFAVIYVTIYARRLEIGMMKAVGTRNWELTGMLSIESIAMTLSAALAGILAGASMGYLLALQNNVSAQRPMLFAFDNTVMPFVVVMVVLASLVGTIFSARRIVKRKAVEILRMS